MAEAKVQMGLASFLPVADLWWHAQWWFGTCTEYGLWGHGDCHWDFTGRRGMLRRSLPQCQRPWKGPFLDDVHGKRVLVGTKCTSFIGLVF
jgi:hypothetical protein